MRFRIFGLMAVGLLAACTSGTQSDATQAVADSVARGVARGVGEGAQPAALATSAAVRAALGRDIDDGFAPLADHGNLMAADMSRKSHKSGAYTFHPVALSEAHALNAVGPGRELVVTAPNGRPIRLHYERHVEHDDGNWTWIGREANAAPGQEAILTFGPKAAFGSIPDGDNAPLRLNVAAGKAWMVETDSKMIAASNSVGVKPRAPDSLLLRLPDGESLTLGRQAAASAPTSLMAATQATPTVDVLVGYTSAFASRLGGQSQARTRVNFMVDVTNQAYASSQIPGRVRLVHSMQVSYPDATSNEDALYDLTGWDCSGEECSQIPIPASLQAMHTARETYGADLISLVRVFNDPENDSCGIAWLNGGGLLGITAEDEVGGISVVSDSSGNLYPDDSYFCREETFAHELGHNMGSAHDIETSKGDDGVLEEKEHGVFTYSFGHKTGGGQGNFYTVMAYGDSGQQSYRVFSNPRITSCGGFPCGVTDSADNARSLTNTMPIVATFRPTKVAMPGAAPDVYAIRKNGTTKTEVYTLSGATGYKSLSPRIDTILFPTGTGSDWEMHLGDFNRDGVQDLWAIRKMGPSGKTEVHIMNGATNFGSYLLNVATVLGQTGTNNQWVFDVGHYNADNKLDLWAINRVGASGKTEVHVLDGATGFKSFLLNKATVLGPTGTNNGWKFELADYNKDGRLDLYAIAREGASGKTEVHVLNGATLFQSYYVNKATVLARTGTDNSWDFKVGEFNNDNKPDVFAIAKMGASGKTEVHVLNGATLYQGYLINSASALGQTGSDGLWEFALPGQ